jgi:NHL repeat
MKSSRILLTLSIAMISFGCKKDNPVSDPPATPPVIEPKVTVSTLAGGGTPSYEDGPFLTAKFNSPIDLVFSNGGSLFVTDIENHRVREMKQGLVSGFAGSDTINIMNGRGQAAAFRFPFSITSDLAGNLYTSDINDPRIRKITPDGVVSVYAGVEEEGFRDGNADSARFYIANFIVSDDQGNVYVSEPLDNRIRKISNTGTVSSIAGTGMAGFNDGDGAAAEFHNPGGITIDRSSHPENFACRGRYYHRRKFGGL